MIKAIQGLWPVSKSEDPTAPAEDTTESNLEKLRKHVDALVESAPHTSAASDREAEMEAFEEKIKEQFAAKLRAEADATNLLRAQMTEDEKERMKAGEKKEAVKPMLIKARTGEESQERRTEQDNLKRFLSEVAKAEYVPPILPYYNAPLHNVPTMTWVLMDAGGAPFSLEIVDQHALLNILNNNIHNDQNSLTDLSDRITKLEEMIYGKA